LNEMMPCVCWLLIEVLHVSIMRAHTHARKG
jgi:hypothetical protein